MNKEIKGEKEINLSHDLSGRLNVRKERRELNEFRREILTGLKTA